MPNRTVAALAGAAFMAACTMASSAHATVGTPISGTPVGLEGDPGSIMVARGTTDGKGSFTFKGLAPGRYILVINGSELAAAMGKRMPPETERKESHSSFGLGIGGAIFGNGGNGGNGSGRASSGREGASPVKGGSSHHSSSGGGMGVGISIPVGDDPGKEELENKKKDYDWDEAVGDLKIDISWGRGDGPGDAQGGTSVALPYCGRTSSHDLRIGFTVPKDVGPAGIYDSLGRVFFVGGTIKY